MIEEEKAIFITKNVVFENPEYQIVRNLVVKEGYGRRGFSIALRKIIREWANLHDPNQGYLDWAKDNEIPEAEKTAG